MGWALSATKLTFFLEAVRGGRGAVSSTLPSRFARRSVWFESKGSAFDSAEPWLESCPRALSAVEERVNESRFDSAFAVLIIEAVVGGA